MFTLSKIEEHWHSNATDIPSWLQQAETDLGNIIEKELSA
jgi:hypothetical protein